MMSKNIRRQYQNNQMGSDLFQNPFDAISDALAGGRDFLGEALNNVNANLQIVMDQLDRNLHDVWNNLDMDNVFKSLGEIVQQFANIMVRINSATLWYDFLTTNEVTRHSFAELDKFSGGMLTSYVNVSTLIARAARGDAISKVELLKDAVFALQVVSVLYGGPAAAGALLGALTGKEACKNAGDAKDACTAAFIIAGAAVGSYTGAVYGTGAGAATGAAAEAGAGAGEAAAEGSFSDYLEEASYDYIQERITEEGTRQAVVLCQNGHLLGDKECVILGQIAKDFINSDADNWPEFLAEEVARIGVSLLIEQIFPRKSPEAVAIRRRYLSPPDPMVTNVVVIGPDGLPVAQNKKPSKFLWVAGGALALAYLGS